MTCFAPLFPLSLLRSLAAHLLVATCPNIMLIATVDTTKLESFFHTSTLHKNVSPFIFKQKKYIYVLTIHIIHTNIFLYIYIPILLKFSVTI